MSENLRYWLWLSRALGAGAAIKSLCEEFGGAKEIYNSNIIEWRMSPSLSLNQINRLESTSLNSIEEIIYTCEQNGWKIIDFDDERYPNRLKEIYNPPAVLFVDGELPDIDNSLCIGVVGTRKASAYAVKSAHIMSRGIAEAGAVVVSGGALGVDTASHKGAIMAGGKTISVLGCGLGANYLMKNAPLRDVIKRNGALITEYPPFESASKYTFPMRNRIISGLSLGVLVVEASVKSGSLITAKHALEQGRDVFAIPSSVLDVDFRGTNKLIEDGAYVATTPESILSVYRNRFDTVDMSKVRSIEELMYDNSDKGANTEDDNKDYVFDHLEEGRQQRIELENKALSLAGDLKTVYYSLEKHFENADVIIEKSRLQSSKVMSALMQLELMGLVKSASGKRYKQS
ncbi:MAG: DNA-processing protein DprA [Eubacterium sp.]|nr:DNA-processing protein DprA [Eubacterium sp.]